MKTQFKSLILAGLLLAAGAASAQPSPPAQNDQPTALIVMNATAARLDGQKLVLSGVTPRAILFTNRPARDVGLVPTADLLALWTTGTFADNPPNATISAFYADGSDVAAVVAVLKSPKLEGDQLTFDVQVLGGSFGDADGPASIFIDTVWFQSGRYIGQSQTQGQAPAIGSRRDTSNFNDGGWSNPAPSAAPPSYVAPRAPQPIGTPVRQPAQQTAPGEIPMQKQGIIICGRPPSPPCY